MIQSFFEWFGIQPSLRTAVLVALFSKEAI